MYEIKTGVARPGPKQSGGRSDKYPLAQMPVDGYIVVPKSDMTEIELEMPPSKGAKKFRDRVNQAVRTYKQRVNSKAHLEPGYDEKTYVPVDFTVLTLGAPPEDNPDAWEEGDVGVWRDS